MSCAAPAMPAAAAATFLSIAGCGMSASGLIAIGLIWRDPIGIGPRAIFRSACGPETAISIVGRRIAVSNGGHRTVISIVGRRIATSSVGHRTATEEDSTGAIPVAFRDPKERLKAIQIPATAAWATTAVEPDSRGRRSPPTGATCLR